MKKYLIPESEQFYKANLHCHTTVSDGLWTPEETKERYMARGYSIVAYTDHDVMIPHRELTDERFLALVGHEVEINEPIRAGQPARSAKTCHMCFISLSEKEPPQVCWHRSKYAVIGNAASYAPLVKFDESLPDYEREYTPECISDMARRAREAGFFVSYNHPTWSLENYNDYMNYDNISALEIANYGCYEHGFGDYNPRVYDDMLMGGHRIFCCAGDDNHGKRADSFGAWTMIKAPSLDYASIAHALEVGDFYASMGPEIHALWIEDGKVHINCSPADTISINTGTRRADAVRGDGLTHAEFNIFPDSDYFRLTVTDAQGKNANTNAYFIDTLNIF